MIKKINKVALASALTLSFIASDVYSATEWNVSLWSKRRAFTEHVEKLAELVSAKTKGDFQLNISYGGLSKNKENLDGIAIGAFEMAQFCSFYHAAKNPTITVTELPFAKDVSLQRLSEISQAVYKHPAVAKDLARWNATLLMPSPLPQYNIIGVGDTPKTLADFKGKRLRGPGGIAGVMKQLGAVKTGVAANEVRQALDSGVIDTVAFAQHAHLAFGSIQAGKWATTNLNLGTANCPVVVNSDALASLSAENKEALLSSVQESLDHYVANYDGKVVAKYNTTIAEKGIESVTFTPAQTAELNTLAESVRTEWIKKYKNQFDAQALYDFTAAEFAK
ncbi:MAG: TRAP-type C4-dicarboxylate transport system substrate-binding protein [Candidatus Endobugula sp.]|jgi:TRAP-type C4-dicarboxylate transport system substrate-binding protein